MTNGFARVFFGRVSLKHTAGRNRWIAHWTRSLVLLFRNTRNTVLIMLSSNYLASYYIVKTCAQPTEASSFTVVDGAPTIRASPKSVMLTENPKVDPDVDVMPSS